MKGRAAVVSAVLATGLLSGAPAAAATGVHIRKIDNSAFPATSMTVSIRSDHRPRPSDVRITEDDRTIVPTSVTPLSQSGTDVDIALVIDTSGSMKGEPIASATAAALRFVTKLPDHIRVGIVTFSNRPQVLEHLTLDHDRALAALGRLKAAGETALYDGVRAGAALFSGPSQRNLIVLSDGGDTASNSDLDSATRVARRARAAVYTVGLTSGEFDAGVLRSLSQKTGGRYSPVATADLGSLYDDLAAELTNQYVVEFESHAAGGAETSVAISTDAGSDRALVLTPEIEAPAVPKPAPRVEPGLALTGSTGLLTALALYFLAVFAVAVMALGTNARRKRDRELARRTAVDSRPSVPTGTTQVGAVDWIPEPLVEAAERVAGRDFGSKLEAKLERSGVALRVGEFLVGCVLASFAGMLLAALLWQNLLLGFMCAGASASGPYVWLRLMIRRRSKKIHDQLADILMIVANALRAGHSFFQALDLVSKEVGSPAKEEFGRVVAEVRLGRPVNEAMDALAERIGSEDFKWALLAVNIQKEVGGNLAEVLDTVSDTIRERDGIRRQIDVLTAEGRLSVGILTALPIVVGIYMAWVNPKYIGLLFNNALGFLMTVVATCLLTVGVFWMKKVVKIDV